METWKFSNPKDMIGSDKLPLHLWPETATIYGCLGLLEGMLKYGRSNWRKAGVRASIYADALKRHVNAYFEGEDDATDSGLPHLAHALACIAILIDAKAAGKLVDDRMVEGGYLGLVESMTPHVARLKAKYADRSPRHYTIADNGLEGEETPEQAVARRVRDLRTEALLHALNPPMIVHGVDDVGFEPGQRLDVVTLDGEMWATSDGEREFFAAFERGLRQKFGKKCRGR